MYVMFVEAAVWIPYFVFYTFKWCIRGKSPNMGRFPNMVRCIISYQEVLRSLLKNVNDETHEAVLCNQGINGQLLRNSILTGRLCFGAL